MKVATWNVNSLKVRLPHVLDWLASDQPDVLCLQETKTTDDQFPLAELNAAGYQCAFAGQKTYNGVATLVRGAEPEEVVSEFPGIDDDDRRTMAVTVNGVRVINLYVVNGKSVDHPAYEYKLSWLTAVREFIADELTRHPDMVVVGDFNIAPDDRDVHDPDKWREKILCSTPERNMLRSINDLGLFDTFRIHHEDGGLFSWWDYRAAAFRRDLGLRIDLVLASPSLSEACTSAWIDVEPRRLERPSDHTPVVAEFAW